MNKVIIMGKLTRDPEVKYTPKGMAIANLGMALNHKFKNAAGEMQEEVTFVDVTAFSKQAELCGEYLKKGASLLVEGRLKTESWDDKQTGQKRSKMVVIMENMHFIGGKKEDAGTRPQQQETRDYKMNSRPASKPDAALNPPDDTDDVPF